MFKKQTYLITPNSPSLSIPEVKTTEPFVEASECASWSHSKNGNIGILINIETVKSTTANLRENSDLIEKNSPSERINNTPATDEYRKKVAAENNFVKE